MASAKAKKFSLAKVASNSSPSALSTIKGKASLKEVTPAKEASSEAKELPIAADSIVHKKVIINVSETKNNT